MDIHSHVLPGIDDGSKSVEESLLMLAASARQGVRRIAATPHFYPMENSPEQFLSRRDEAEKWLRKAWQPGLPELMMGAEVYFFDGMSHTDALDEFRLEGTGLLLLEMPLTPWTARQIQEVEKVQSRSGITVLMAHIERYLKFQDPQVWDELRQAGVLMQCNAEFFLHWRTKRKALRMVKAGEIHFLGSDCHNMSTRPPRLGEAVSLIGQEERDKLNEIIREYIPEPF